MTCDICWTSSFEPVPDDDPGAVKDPHGEGYMRCGYCWLDKQYVGLAKKYEELIGRMINESRTSNKPT